MRGVMQEHIERTMSRYDGRIAVWDVINEPVGDVAYGPYSLREGPFLARLGPQYVAESFRMARAAAPAAKLVLNETHTERDDRFGRGYRQDLLFLIDRLQEEGVPIDGIGLQGHLNPGVHFDLDAFFGFLAEIERRKLFIEITELDINDDSFPADEAVRDAAVAEAYRRYLDRVLANKAVRSLTFWQLGDAASWYNSASVHNTAASSRRPRPLLFDASMRPKPALFAVVAALQAMPTRVSSK
jgi:endo-1,4-beta-xylanase